jgi:hypothetical protein
MRNILATFLTISPSIMVLMPAIQQLNHGGLSNEYPINN